MARNNKGRNILITRFSALGDVAMTIPVVYSACAANPDVRFIFVTRSHAARLFVNRPDNLEVVGVDLDSYRGIGGMIRLASELRNKYSVTDYADLHDVVRTKILRLCMRIAGIPVRHLNKGKRGRRALTREKNKVFLPLVSMRMRYREVFHSLGLSYKDSFNGLFDTPPSPEVFAEASAPKNDGEIWIGIAPFARHAGKIYPADMMEKVVARLSTRPGYRIFLFGAGTEEMNTLGRWSLKYDNAVSLASLSLGLDNELRLLYYCDAVISMDSANMHLASLTGTRVVSVWGATHPYCGFMGWRQKKDDAVQLDMVCRPCSVFGDKPCRFGDYHCMHGITPDHILSVLDRRLS